MKKLLISGLGGSLFPYLHYKLIRDGFDPVYVDSNADLKYVYPEFNFYPAPMVSDPDYAILIREIFEKESIEGYVPLIDEEIILAHQIAEDYGHILVFAPTKEFTKLCLDKYLLMNELIKSEISINPTYIGSEFDWQIDAPLFIKPNVGRGSRGIKRIDNPEQLSAYYKLEDYSAEETIIQNYIPGVEYTVGVLTNHKNKVLSISPKRVLKKKGITLLSVTENNQIIENLAYEINDKFYPQGPFNIQLFIRDDGSPAIFEINPRFSTTLVQSYEAGLSEISLFLNHLEDEDPLVSFGKEGVYLSRHWENRFYAR
ncbi:ATP-grasp domain-containing protein [Roseivirga sp.]|uniref:ATP-grasp domain-containing protein n=1 Tax=Roseivirga sp. TaxID=1964215 RepID=UPI003B517F6C